VPLTARYAGWYHNEGGLPQAALDAFNCEKPKPEAERQYSPRASQYRA